jgi:A/G-specific adenine glycosylase
MMPAFQNAHTVQIKKNTFSHFFRMDAPTTSRPLTPTRWRRSLAKHLLAWFAEQARDLPWRKTRDLYAIWVSEIMLQQTQVVTVVAYYERFLARFPTVSYLAAAQEEEVLRLWEGLGYYRRGRQLHAAAKVIVEKHAGEFPDTFDEVVALPGIGRYTAGAILSIGRDARLPILEANTIRVLSRLLAYAGDVYGGAGQKLLWEFAEELLPPRDVGHFNQALMELGALVCTPREPACLLCPLRELCPTRKAGLTASIPAPKQKTKYEDLTEAAIVVHSRSGKILVRRCQAGERWAGLWDFPRVAVDGDDLSLPHNAIAAAVQKLTGISIQLGDQITTLKHGVTRYRITLHCFHAEHRAGKIHAARHDALRWITPDELHALPLSTTGRKLCQLIAVR